mmetsp:Transcript_13201/g.39898  ORF Transcript_13201/g.39898 Transcript_13201/m.39898 type:complete len:113 (+) Transcript_13201:59-397(+)
MAAENDHEIEEEQAPAKGAAGEQARSLAALDGAADVSLDSTKASKALSGIAADGSANEVLRKQQEQQLAAVKVSKEDIQVIVAELELSTKEADLALRKNGGNLESALRSLVA